MSESLIYTVGHSNHPAEKFVGLLNAYGIQVLFDIRSMPYSRYNPQYNKENLRRTLEKAGICYVFAGERLGGRIGDPSCYKAGVIPERKVNIAELVDFDQLCQRPWYQAGIALLLREVRERKIVIMCSEEDPACCHRDILVSRKLRELGVTVGHIRGDGRLETTVPENGSEVWTQTGLF